MNIAIRTGLALAALSMGVSVRAEDGTTNSASVYYTEAWIQADGRSEKGEGLWTSFVEKSSVNASRSLFDQFGPEQAVSWTFDNQTVGYDSIGRLDADGAIVFMHSAIYGAREVFVESDFISIRNEWLRHLLDNSVGNIPEENVNPLSTVPSVAEALLWDQMEHEDRVLYGLRPFNQSPYAYASFRFGHSRGGPLAVDDVRASYDPPQGATFTENISVRLIDDLWLSGGASYRDRRDGAETVLSARLEERSGQGVKWIGISTNQNGIEVNTGLYFWF